MFGLWSWVRQWLWPPEKPKVPPARIPWPSDKGELRRVMVALLNAKEGDSVRWREAGKVYTLTAGKSFQIK